MSHKIGITACSNPMHPSFSADLARLCQILRELGFDPVLSPCLYDNGSSFSGTGAERADALMNLYCDPEITDIFDVSGGDMANEILPYLDFSVIAASGKLSYAEHKEQQNHSCRCYNQSNKMLLRMLLKKAFS